MVAILRCSVVGAREPMAKVESSSQESLGGLLREEIARVSATIKISLRKPQENAEEIEEEAGGSWKYLIKSTRGLGMTRERTAHLHRSSKRGFEEALSCAIHGIRIERLILSLSLTLRCESASSSS